MKSCSVAKEKRRNNFICLVGECPIWINKTFTDGVEPTATCLKFYIFPFKSQIVSPIVHLRYQFGPYLSPFNSFQF